MALKQSNNNAVWTESKGAAQAEITNIQLIDQGGYYDAGAGAPDALLLDKGHGAYETVESGVNVDGDPQLGLIDIGGAVIMTYE
jgi:hypothetical protein